MYVGRGFWFKVPQGTLKTCSSKSEIHLHNSTFFASSIPCQLPRMHHPSLCRLDRIFQFPIPVLSVIQFQTFIQFLTIIQTVTLCIAYLYLFKCFSTNFLFDLPSQIRNVSTSIFLKKISSFSIATATSYKKTTSFMFLSPTWQKHDIVCYIITLHNHILSLRLRLGSTIIRRPLVITRGISRRWGVGVLLIRSNTGVCNLRNILSISPDFLQNFLQR